MKIDLYRNTHVISYFFVFLFFLFNPSFTLASLKNVSLEKATYQSSYFDNIDSSWEAVDGDKTSGDNHSHTNKEASPWWEVDLWSVQKISKIKIYNRNSKPQSYASALKDFYIFASKERLEWDIAKDGKTLVFHPGTLWDSKEFSVDTEARYVRVQLSGEGYLHMSEVEIYTENDESYAITLEWVSPSENSAIVQFRTPQNTQAYIEYGETESYGSTNTKENSFRFSSHSQTLSNLDSGKKYFYRINTKDIDGNAAIKKGDFTTLWIQDDLQILSHRVEFTWSNQANVVFKTNEKTQASIAYGQDKKYDFHTVLEASFRFDAHSQPLKWLEAWKSYQYLIMVQNQDGNKKFAKWTFTSPKTSPWGTTIKNTDWDIRQSNNVKFWNHSGDTSFRPSKPGDTDAIRVTVEKWEHYGTGTDFKFPKWTQEAWVSYCIRPWYNWKPISWGKLPWFAGNSTPSNGWQGWASSTGNNAWSARGLYGIYNSSKKWVAVGSYIYHTNQKGKYGDADWWGPGSNTLFSQANMLELNKWYAVKQHIKINSLWKRDGLLEAWIDGEKVYSNSTLNFTNNNSFREIYRFWLDVYFWWGKTALSDHYVYFDQVNYSLGPNDKTSVECIN